MDNKEPISALDAAFKTGEYATDRTMWIRISSEAYDREKDRTSNDGWDFSDYELNPVVLWNHDQSIPSPAKCEQIRQENGYPEAKVRFAKTPFGEELLYLYKKGYLNACSPTFTSNSYTQNSEGGKDFHSQKMIELSLVTVPANQEAVVTQRSLKLKKSQFPLVYEYSKDLVHKMESYESKPYSGPNDPELMDSIDGIENLSEEQRAVWVEVFNQTLNDEEDNEQEAAMAAWSVVNSNTGDNKMKSLKEMLQANQKRLEAVKEKIVEEDGQHDQEDKQLDEDAKAEIMGMLQASHDRISTMEEMLQGDVSDEVKQELMGIMAAEEEAMEMTKELLGIEEELEEEDNQDLEDLEDKQDPEDPEDKTQEKSMDPIQEDPEDPDNSFISDDDQETFEVDADDLAGSNVFLLDLEEFDFSN